MSRPQRLSLLALLYLLVQPPALGAQAVVLDSIHVQRLAALGRVWGVVKYFHPALLRQSVNWDSAGVATVDRARASRTTAEYFTAVEDMFALLDDPATRVATGPPAARQTAAPAVTRRWLPDSVLVISIPSSGPYDLSDQLADAVADVRLANRLVVDLRSTVRDQDSGMGEAFSEAGLDSELVSGTVVGPTQLRRMYFWLPARGSPADRVASTYTIGGEVIRGAAARPGRHTAFVVNSNSELPPVAFGMQQAGSAYVVFDASAGPLSTYPDPVFSPSTFSIPLERGARAVVRLAEAVTPSGSPIRPDTTVRGNALTDDALHAALSAVSGSWSAREQEASYGRFPSVVPTEESQYPDTAYPSFAYRILAAYRYWNAFELFSPFRPEVAAWPDALASVINAAAQAKDGKAYALAIADLAVRTGDSHSVVSGGAMTAWRGEGRPAVQLQYIDGSAVVVEVEDDSATKASGIRRGDIIVSVDGTPTETLRRQLAPFMAHSNAAALDYRVSEALLRGPPDSDVRLTLQRGPRTTLEIRLLRRPSISFASLWPVRGSPIVQVLPGNIGYVDLSRLTESMVDSMFDALRSTRGIVFDDRGYPQGTSDMIAARLIAADSIRAGTPRRNLVMSPEPRGEIYEWPDYIRSFPSGHYKGRTVVLVNEFTGSQAEGFAARLRAAGTTVVGSQTIGTGGDIERVYLPGGLTASMSVNASGWHGPGVRPDIYVRPTIQGVRAGRDEVLERAVRFIRSGK